ncbi:unnamed protein product [Chrysoparadoxa australica]
MPPPQPVRKALPPGSGPLVGSHSSTLLLTDHPANPEEEETKGQASVVKTGSSTGPSRASSTQKSLVPVAERGPDLQLQFLNGHLFVSSRLPQGGAGIRRPEQATGIGSLTGRYPHAIGKASKLAAAAPTDPAPVQPFNAQALVSRPLPTAEAPAPQRVLQTEADGVPVRVAQWQEDVTLRFREQLEGRMDGGEQLGPGYRYDGFSYKQGHSRPGLMHQDPDGLYMSWGLVTRLITLLVVVLACVAYAAYLYGGKALGLLLGKEQADGTKRFNPSDHPRVLTLGRRALISSGGFTGRKLLTDESLQQDQSIATVSGDRLERIGRPIVKGATAASARKLHRATSLPLLAAVRGLEEGPIVGSIDVMKAAQRLLNRGETADSGLHREEATAAGEAEEGEHRHDIPNGHHRSSMPESPQGSQGSSSTRKSTATTTTRHRAMSDLAAVDPPARSRSARYMSIEPITNLSGNTSPYMITLRGGANGERDIALVNGQRYVSEFIEGERLGKGGFGTVYKGTNRLDGIDYAIKKIRLSSHASLRPQLEKVLREVKILALLDHANIVRYYQAWLECIDERELEEETTREARGGGLNSSRRDLTSGWNLPTSRLDSSRAGDPFVTQDEREGEKRVGSQELGLEKGRALRERDRVVRMSLDDNDGASVWSEGSSYDSEGESLSLKSKGRSSLSPAHRNCSHLRRGGSVASLGSLTSSAESMPGFEFDRDDVHEIQSGDECFELLSGASTEMDNQLRQDTRQATYEVGSGVRQTTHEVGSKPSPARSSSSTCQADKGKGKGKEWDWLEGDGNTSSTGRGEAWDRGMKDGKGRVKKGPAASGLRLDSTVNGERDREMHDLAFAAGMGVAEERGDGSSRSNRKTPRSDRTKRKKPQVPLDLWLYIQMQYCSQNTLQDYLEAPERIEAGKGIDIPQVLHLFSQVAKGLAYVHSTGLIHRDLKPANCFLLGDGTVKIGDFGLSRHAESDQLENLSTTGMAGEGSLDPALLLHSLGGGPGADITPEKAMQITSGVGTYLYASPEQMSGKDYDELTDIYSLGMVLFEMCHSAFHTLMERIVVLSNVQKQEYPSGWGLPREHPKIYTLIQGMLQHDPSLRPSASEVVRQVESMQGKHTLLQLDRCANRSNRTVLQVEAEEKAGLLHRLVARVRQVCSEGDGSVKLEQYGLRGVGGTAVIELLITGAYAAALDTIRARLLEEEDVHCVSEIGHDSSLNTSPDLS